MKAAKQLSEINMLNTQAPVKGTSKHGRSADLMRKLQYDLNFDAAEELVKLYRNSKMDLSGKMRIAETMMKYQYPALKAHELKANQGELITFNIDLSGVCKDEAKED